MKTQSDILVSICCITYNQAPYIRQCMDGFIMQKTNFKFEIIVHDDCSTDGTTDIVKEYADKYPDLIVPIFQEINQYQNGNKSILATFVYPKATGKYIALCEGDDYWIDPLKLQKQVDFLESHPDYSMVHTRFYYCKMDHKELVEDTANDAIIKKIINNSENLAYYILKNNSYRIQTVTVVYRKECYNRIVDNLENEKGLFLMGDTQLWLNLMQQGKIKYLDEITSVYRLSSDSASRSTDEIKRIRFALSCEEMRLYYSKKLGIYDKSFYFDYIKILYKYLMFEPNYRSDERIIKYHDIDLISKMIIKSNIMSCMKVFRKYIS